MVQKRYISVFWSGYLLSLFLLSSCLYQDNFPVGTSVTCSAEALNTDKDKFEALDDSTALFNGGKLQSKLEAHSGKYSVLTSQDHQYAFGHTIKNVGPKWYFRVSVWRKSKNGGGLLVASGKNPALSFLNTDKVFETDENGWERLELDVFTPHGFQQKELTFYVWNNTGDTVFYDDFVVERHAAKNYPDFQMELLSIYVDTTDWLKINKKREEAFENGILQTTDKDWVKGIVTDNDDILEAKMRLKGDWLDHLRGDKWSYRIKLKRSYRWNRMRTFSIQTPAARGYLYEWIAHRFFDDQDILTTRYEFIPVKFNNIPRGLYAWEEHFEKQLLEYRNRREGPILKFSEDAFWQSTMVSTKRKTENTLPYYQAAVIEPFNQNKTVSNNSLFNQFLNGQKLMMQYKNQVGHPSDIFDLDKLAKYYAMMDVSHARHGTAWHNQRFYFNPVLCKLEPIAFDGFGEHLGPLYGYINNYGFGILKHKTMFGNEQDLATFIFRDSSFTNKYLHYLGEFSSEDYINMMQTKLENDITYWDSVIRLEFPYYSFDSNYISKGAQEIQAYLPMLKKFIQECQEEEFNVKVVERNFEDEEIFEKTPGLFVNAYLKNGSADSSFIEIYSYYPNELIILGTGRKQKYIDYFEHPEPGIDSYKGEPQVIEIVSDTAARFLFFMVEGNEATYKTEIYPWSYPSGLTPQQELMTTINLEDNLAIERIDGSNIYIRQEIIELDQPLIIPEGYIVHFLPGTKLDLIEGAMFISYSTVLIQGTENMPVVIGSSDFSGQGFTVLQADTRSKVNHAIFENLNTLDFKGWTLTGAVNFYESDVDITNTLFYRNQCEDALNTIRSDFKLESSTFDNTFGDAFDSDFCTGSVVNARFDNIGNDAIDFSGSKILIKDTEIKNANDKGISGGEDSYLTVENTIISQSNIGLASKDLSVVQVKNSKVMDCNYGIVLLQKKPEYGSAKMIIKNTLVQNAKTEYLIEIGSEVEIDGKKIKGDQKNLSLIFY